MAKIIANGLRVVIRFFDLFAERHPVDKREDGRQLFPGDDIESGGR